MFVAESRFSFNKSNGNNNKYHYDCQALVVLPIYYVIVINFRIHWLVFWFGYVV